MDGVPISLIRYRYKHLVAPQRLAGIDIPVASFKDLCCMKLSAIAARGAFRDFWDLHAILGATRATLASALVSYQQKYASEDVGHVVRALVFFEDADREPRPKELSEAAWDQINRDLATWVQGLS